MASIELKMVLDQILLDHTSWLPIYRTDGAAGFDLATIEEVVLRPGDLKIVRTGIRVEVPPGFELQIRSRSGLGTKDGIVIAHGVGTVDSDYRGELLVALYMLHLSSDGVDPVVILTPGMFVAQAILAPVTRAQFSVVPELSPTTRGSGGFGSTGV